MATQNKKWVIVFLVYADFRTDDNFSMNEEMKKEINCLFEDIMTTPMPSQNYRLFVILNGIKYLDTSTGNPKVESKAIFYEIKSPGKKAQNQFAECRIIDSATFETSQPNPIDDLQNRKKLQQTLEYISVSEDENTLFITWDHGSAFGIFRDDIPSLPVERTPIDDEEDLKKFPFLRLFWKKALEKNGDFKKFILEKGRSSFHYIQSGATLYKLSVVDRISDLFIRTLSSDHTNPHFYIKELNNKHGELILEQNKFQHRLGENANPDPHLFEGFQPGDSSVIELVDKDVTEILKNQELSFAITGWLQGRKVNVLLMMNCWLMNLHTMYSFRESVEFLVAPQGDITIPGYNCRDIFKYLYKEANNEKPVIELARECVRTSENKFQRRRLKKLTGDDSKIDVWRIYAANLQAQNAAGENILIRQINAWKNLIDSMISALDDNNNNNALKPELKFILKYIRASCFDFSDSKAFMIDILTWLQSVKYANSRFHPGSTKVPKELMDEITAFIKLLSEEKNFLLPPTAGKDIYHPKDDDTQEAVIGLPPTAYSFFFPQFKFSDMHGLLDNVKGDQLLTEVLPKWKDFLQRIDPHIEF